MENAKERQDPLCIPPAEAVELLRGAPWQRFAVMGDSFAAGVGSPSPGYADVSWPDRVVNALRGSQPDLAYLNTGVTGLKTAQVLEGQLEQVLAFRPDLVNVAAGGNDLFVAEPDLDATEANLEAIYSALTDQKVHIFAFTVANVFDAFPEMAGFRARVADLNSRTRAVAARHDATLIDMWEHPVRLEPTLMGDDGIHFSRHGHAVLATEIVKHLSTRVA